MFGIQLCGLSRDGIEVERDDGFRTGAGGSECSDPGTSAEIDNAFIADAVRVVEQITCESLPAAPAERPEWRCLAVGQLLTGAFDVDIIVE